MQTYPEMNGKIVGILRQHNDPVVGYAAARIEELERQLREAREAAQAQSEEIQRTWLSPAEAEGLRQQLEIERQARLVALTPEAMLRIWERVRQLQEAEEAQK